MAELRSEDCCTISEFARDYAFSPWGVRRMVASGIVRSMRDHEGRLLLERPAGEQRQTVNAADYAPRLTRSMVADIIGVSPVRVSQLSDAGQLRFHMVGRKRRYSVEQVFNYLSGKHNTAADRARGRMVAWATTRLSAKAAAIWSPAEPERFETKLRQIEFLPERQRATALARLVLYHDRLERKRARRAEAKVRIPD